MKIIKCNLNISGKNCDNTHLATPKYYENVEHHLKELYSTLFKTNDFF